MAMMPQAQKDVVPPVVPHGRWDRVVTATPIVLTIMATVLAGLSSSEMIQAQYHRSLAAQHQSKAGDQWNFFQAKRLRGTLHQQAVGLLAGAAAPVDPHRLLQVVDEIAMRLQAGEEKAKRLGAAIAQASSVQASAAGPVRGAADSLAKAAHDAGAQAAECRAEAAAILDRADVKAALTYLGSDRLPAIEKRSWETPEIRRAIEAIQAGAPEDQVALLVPSLRDDKLEEALQIAAANARAFEDAGKGVDHVLDDLDRVLKKPQALAHQFHRRFAAVSAAAVDGDAALALARDDAALVRLADEFKDYQAAREDYTARRNEAEARNNQETAGLYELRVSKSGVISEGHRRRSKHFFYGMLCAQAGVAVASMSLAARHRSALWAFAGVAGLTAALFSVYVYLFI